MENKIFENMDKRPKRYRDKYNPYKLFTIGINTNNPKYYISFTDSSGTDIFMEIGKEIFDAFDRFELDDISHMNRVGRYYEHFELSDESLNNRATTIQESVDEIVAKRIDKDKLYEAISKLPELQRKRLILYYFKNMTFKEIADLEECKYQAIQDSIERAKSKLKEFLT
jgi:RNA polymerase sigma-70 factor (ECF subfamily)